MKLHLLSLLTVSTAAAAIPAVGPDYVRPTVETPPAYRTAASPDSWKAAAPSDTSLRGDWWTLFQNPELNSIESLALSRNQDLKIAAARVEEANAEVGVVRAGLFPQVALDPSLSRGRSSETTANPFPNAVATDYNAPLSASWELDVFGRVRRLSEGARAQARASADLFESVKLSLAASVATNFFLIRGTDTEMEIVARSVALRKRELDLITSQQRVGAATEFDTARAQAELASTEADLLALAARRESLQDSLAVLAGEPAATFSVTPSTGGNTVPAVPAGLPSDVLERRPDVAAAERQLAAASARIGVAKAAFFPAISLTGGAGYESAETASLLRADSRVWSIGPSLYLPLFQGGRNTANLERAKAAYQEQLAIYRQQVLVAFREVQEALAVSRILGEESAAQDRAVSSAERASGLATTRFKAGYTSYLDVILAQRTELSSERAFAELTTARLTNAVSLVKALGGGWTREDMRLSMN
jgi:multidrug efflux system outer membrane protein